MKANKNELINQIKKLKKYLKNIFIILFLSIVLNLFFIFKSNKPSSISNSRNESSFLQKIDQFDELICDNPAVENEMMPMCPKGDGAKILSRIYPAHSIYVGYQENNNHIAFIQENIRTALSLDTPVPVIIMTPRNKLDVARNDFAYLPANQRKFVRFLPTPSDYTVWAQDYFEFAYARENSSFSIIDLPYEAQSGEFIPAAVALACKANLISQSTIPNDEQGKLSGNFGGNIEAITDEVVMVGDNMSPTQIMDLARITKQKIIKLNVSWLKTGHVDEIVSMIPKNKNFGDKCDFDILYASPGLALDLVRKAPNKIKRKPLVLRFGYGKEQQKFNLWNCFGSEANSKGCKFLRNGNASYEKIIQENIKKLKNAIEQYSKCKDVRFRPLPLMFTSAQYREHFGTDQDDAIAIDPNPINNILIGNQILVPKQKLSLYYEYVKKILKEYSLETTFVDSEYVHLFEGGLHCSANVRKACRSETSAQ